MAPCLQGDGSQITVEPGLIGGEINKILATHKAKHNHPVQYKIGPDPSSIDSCMVSLEFAYGVASRLLRHISCYFAMVLSTLVINRVG